MRDSTLRSRWAAIGAALAVTAGVGGFGLVQATTPSDATAYVAIAPCRLFDTRTGSDNVGTRSTPWQPRELHTVQVTGSNGNCTIPASATAVVVNFTGTNPTAETFITAFPAGGTRPNASNLNMTAREAPTPNLATVRLSGDGKMTIYNHDGTIDLIADINGYYTNHTHDDRYYTKAEVNTRDKWISIDPLAVAYRSGASVGTGFGVNAGLLLPGGPADLPAFEFGFAMPPDYTTGTDVTVELLWHISETACTINLSSNYASIDHYGAVPTGSTFGYRVADPVPATANQVARSTFTVRSAVLSPGDTVIVGLFRSYNSDTCTQPLHIKGIMVRYT